jgi:putative endonuclease
MYLVYILQSNKSKKYYVGHTKDLNVRIERHNKGLVRSTKSSIPWKVVYVEEYSSRIEAYKRELQIKKYKGGEAFKRLFES